MKKLMLLRLTFLFSFVLFSSLICLSQNSQITNQGILPKINSNTDYQPNGSSDSIYILAQEVYLNCPEYLSNELISIYEALVNRVTIMEVLPEQAENHTLLSQVGLKNKCNPSLGYDNNMTDIALFNPLKYFFNYSASEIVRYRIDGTNYLVSISPKN